MIARACGFAFGLLLGLAVLPDKAAAETVVLMPAAGDDDLLPEAITAHAAVVRALDAQGVRTLAHAAAVDRAGGGELADCRTIDCSSKLVAAARAELAVLVAARNGEAGTTEVRVALVTRDGDRFWGRAEIELGDVSAAAREALLDARGFQLLGEGPFVRVRSAPNDAEVWIDGERAGSTPFRSALRPGRHSFELRKRGYRPHVQMKDLARDTELPLEINAVLQARVASPRAAARLADIESDPSEHDEPESSRPIVGPLLLGALGTAVLVYDIALIASAGCERREPTGACTHPTEVNDTVALALAGVGVAAIGGGLLWFLLGGDDGSDSESSVSVGLSPLHAELRGQF